MPISDFCKHECKEAVEHKVNVDGLSTRAACKEVAKELSETFNEKINAGSLRVKIQRVATNVANDVSGEDNTGKGGNQVNQVEHGGKRKGSGRKKPKPKTGIVSEALERTYEAFLEEVKRAKRSKWKLTSQDAVLERINILYNVTTIR
ncbi:unnamed protein product [marine sediment metagenome]|uniref:Uncharacterized protein n=1 Tax=marine sediment metagenome TaxID=412755 RepID=X0SW21_9ZZZZ